jgi:hypothetical protein
VAGRCRGAEQREKRPAFNRAYDGLDEAFAGETEFDQTPEAKV